jgi:integrase
MTAVTGRRKNNQLGLEPRVYAKHGAFYYVHRDGKWERLGTDIAKANEKARLYNDNHGRYGDMAYWLDMFIADCEKRVAAKTFSQRSVEDYTENLVPLKVFFGEMLPTDIEPHHVQDYLIIGKDQSRGVRANRERACLSSCISWLIRCGHVQGLKINPCFRVSGVKRNREDKRDRYVTHEEYRNVFAQAPYQVRAMMELTYRTLQRPESDILDWTLANLPFKDDKRILRVKQAKVSGTTNKTVDIELSPELEELFKGLVGEVPKIGRPLVCAQRGKHKGKRYTYDGISSMLKYAIAKANAARKKAGMEKIPSFGFRDLKGKGATDMWLDGVPIEKIQLLCGHEDKATTEKYIKQRWRETASPNSIKIDAA